MSKRSIVENDVPGICFLCGRVSTDVHHIFEGSKRKRCDELCITVNLCRDCHGLVHSSKGNEVRKQLHELGQRTYEKKIGSREEFIKDFILSYL